MIHDSDSAYHDHYPDPDGDDDDDDDGGGDDGGDDNAQVWRSR